MTPPPPPVPSPDRLPVFPSGFLWGASASAFQTEGAAQRFGLVRIDDDTLERTPKASYAWYRDAVRAQRAAAARSRD